MQNPRMGGTWHSAYSVSDRQKVVQILAATLKEIQNTNYNEQKALGMAQDFEKYTFLKSATKEEYLNIIKQKVTQLRMGMRNATNSVGNPQAGPGNAGALGAGANGNTGNGDFQGQNMAMYAQNRQQQQLLQTLQLQQSHQRQPLAGNSQQNPQNPQNPSQQQLPPGLQPTQQQIQQIGQMIRTSPIPPALLSKLPNLPPNVNTWTRIYECLQKKIIPTLAMPAIKEVHNAHFQLAVRQHQQQKLTQMRRANVGGLGDGQSSAGAVLDTYGAGNSSTGLANMSSMAGMDVNRNLTAAAKAKLSLNGVAAKNMANMGSMSGMGNMSNMGNMNGMGNVGTNGAINGMGNVNVNSNGMNGMNGMGNMGAMNNMGNMNGMGNINGMNTAPGINGMRNMNGNRQVQSNPVNMQNLPQMANQAAFRGNQLQPQQSMQSSMGMQGQLQLAPLHQQQTQLRQQQQQQQQQQVKPPALQITAQDFAKYSADALALLTKLQQNGSIQANLDQTQKQNFVRKFISHQKLNAWKAQQKNLAQAAPVGQQEQQQQQHMQRQQQKPPQAGANNFLQPQQQLAQPVQPSAHLQLRLPTLLQMGQPNANLIMGQNLAQKRSVSAQGMGSDPNGGNMAQQRMAPGSMTSVMPVLTDEMKMKLRTLFEEVSRNNVNLKDVTMLLSEKEKLEVKESMAKITHQYSNIDSILSYYYALSLSIEGTKRLIQMKNMTKNIFENLQVGIYIAGPDLLEKIRVQYQKHLDYVKEELTRRKAQQVRNQSQSQPLSAPVQGQQQRQGGQFPGQQFASHGAMQHPIPQNFNGMLQGGMGGQVQSQQPQQSQQFMRANTNVPVQSQRTGPNANAAQAIGSSPVMPNASSPPAQQPAKGGPKATKKQTAARRKSTKGGAALPTPVANAATPATLANSIKTPNSIATPQVPASQSAKGTPNASSPQLNGRIPSTTDLVSSTGDVFGASNVDKSLMKRRELSKSDPEKFFFAALSNMLNLEQDSSSEDDAKAKEAKKGIRSPLSPLSSSEWTSDIKSQAITSAFRQVEYIAELTGCDVLQECGELATKELQDKDEESLLKRKRKSEDEDDMDLLFEDKKLKLDDDMEERLFAPIELDDWKSWLGGLQQT